MFMGVCVYVCALCVYSSCGDQKKVLGSLEQEVHSCELPCECWELTPGPLPSHLSSFMVMSNVQY